MENLTLQELKELTMLRKRRSEKIRYQRLPMDTELLSCITNITETEEGRIVIEYTICLGDNNTVKKDQRYSGSYGHSLLDDMLDLAQVDDVVDLIGSYCSVIISKSGNFTNISVVQFYDEDEFEELLNEL